MVKIYFPGNNVGCLGFALGKWFYTDLKGLHLYVRIGQKRWAVSPFTIRKWR